MAFTANDDQSKPEPCKRYAKRMLLNAKFVAHLPGLWCLYESSGSTESRVREGTRAWKVEHPPS
jgi:hypothetical protein